MTILGISCYFHDAAAALIRDGHIIGAAEEERFTRVKHDSSFPSRAIDFCLSEAGITSQEVDYVVFYEKPFRKLHRILTTALSTYPASLTQFREAMLTWVNKKFWIKQEIASTLGVNPEKILFTDHHLSHAASSFYLSPYKRAAILTVDGVGEWATALTAVGNDKDITPISEMNFPHSVGLLYSAFTAYLGFEVNEGEWKVMGLAPYGKPRYTKEVWKTLTLHSDGSINLNLNYFAFHYSDTLSYSQELIDLLGPPVPPSQAHKITKKSADIAASIQVVTEEILRTMGRYLQKISGEKNLCLAGGVALNSVANYRMLRECGFKNIFIQPAAGDSGGALGSALYVYHSLLKKPRKKEMSHAYLGKSYSDYDIEKYLQANAISYQKLTEAELLDVCVRALVGGKVLGWMQGKFEWGPRALGNRSILGDPRNPRMKDIINRKVKFREAFRPFAPSILADHASTVLDLPPKANEHSPLGYMLYVVPVKKHWQKRIPAITHADGSTRPQIVSKITNPRYHKLIRLFCKRTGVPLLLNTSFNLKGEPIVASPHDAYSSYIRSGIDLLVMGNILVSKKP